MRARVHGPLLLPALLALTGLLFPLPAKSDDSPVEPTVRPQPETGNQKPKTDLYGDPLPPGAIARMGTVQFRQAGTVRSIAFSPDGKTLASGSDDKTIRLWEVVTGKELLKVEGQEGLAWSIAFSPDGKMLAFGSGGWIRLCDVATGKELLKIAEYAGSDFPVAFSPDGTKLASGMANTTILIWDVAALLKDRK